MILYLVILLVSVVIDGKSIANLIDVPSVGDPFSFDCFKVFQLYLIISQFYPLLYSCLENSIDGRAWYATVRGVTKSRTQLSDFIFTVIYPRIYFNLSCLALNMLLQPLDFSCGNFLIYCHFLVCWLSPILTFLFSLIFY